MSKVGYIGMVCFDIFYPVDGQPGLNEKKQAVGCTDAPGGVAANGCDAAAKIRQDEDGTLLPEHQVYFIGSVVDDFLKDIILDSFTDEGIDISQVVMQEDGRNPINSIPLYPTGDNNILLHSSCEDVQPGVEDIDREFVQSLDHLAVTAIHYEPHLRALQYAKEPGVDTLTTFDMETQVLDGINAREGQSIDKIIGLIDIITPNKKAALKYLWMDQKKAMDDDGNYSDAQYESAKDSDYTQAAELLLNRFKNLQAVAITLGEEGSLIATREGMEKLPAHDLSGFVEDGVTLNTTGAGDTYNATLAYGVLEGMDIVEAGRVATAAAGKSCTRNVARGGTSYQKVLEFQRDVPLRPH